MSKLIGLMLNSGRLVKNATLKGRPNLISQQILKSFSSTSQTYSAHLVQGTKRAVIKFPHDSLNKKCPDILDPLADEHLRTAADLLATATSNALGLAAPQIAVSQRIFVIRKPLFKNESEARAFLKQRSKARLLDQHELEPAEFIACIDPKIISHKDSTEIGAEACLSCPDFVALVRRYTDITVQYTNAITREVVRERLSGLPAVVFQHELDHLDGVLLKDREVRTFLRRSKEEEFDAAQERFLLGLMKYYGVSQPA